jgi:dTDP-4-dehydrorhamnose reductase
MMSVLAASAARQSKKKWLLLGSSGLLGKEIQNLPHLANIDLDVPSHSTLDIANAEQLIDYLEVLQPHMVINAAAWTDVDGAQASPDQVFRANAGSVEILAGYALKSGGKLIQISTASVFSGSVDQFFSTDSRTNPINEYNKSKALAERFCLKNQRLGADISILRTYWLYGKFAPNFVDFVATQVLEGKPVTVVEDQWGQPTSASDLAETVASVCFSEKNGGILHAVNHGVTSRLNLAMAIVQILNVGEHLIIPTSAFNFGAAAPRPAACSLGTSKCSDGSSLRLRDWKEALSAFLLERYSSGQN